MKSKEDTVRVLAVLIGILAIAIVIAVALQSGVKVQGDIDADAKKKLESAVKKLGEIDDYVVSTSMKAPDGNVQYLEIKKGDVSYTDYPINEDTNEIEVDTDENTTYTLADWYKKDGTMYAYNASATDDESDFYKMPKSYGRFCKDRTNLYANDLLKGLVSLKKVDNEKTALNNGEGELTFNVYRAVIKADTVKEVLGAGTYGLYKSVSEDYAKDEALSKYANMNLEELDMSLTFSDARVKFYVNDGVLRRVNIEVGGLGARLYYDKVVYLKMEYQKRDEPDFSKSKDYVESIRETAEFCKDYDTYEEAFDAMQMDNSTSDDVEEEVEEEVEAEVTATPAPTKKKSSSKKKESKK